MVKLVMFYSDGVIPSLPLPPSVSPGRPQPIVLALTVVDYPEIKDYV